MLKSRGNGKANRVTSRSSVCRSLCRLGLYETFCFVGTALYEEHIHMGTTFLMLGRASYSFKQIVGIVNVI